MGRTIEVIVLVVLIVITAYYYVKARKEASAAKAVQGQEVKIIQAVKIEGMMCEKCAAKVTEALSKFGTVTVNLEEKIAVIEEDELADSEEIKAIVNELGFEFKGIE